MKIDSIYAESFKANFIKPFKIANQIYNQKKGWYIKIKSKGLIGVGEISPLEYFSPDYNLLIEKIIKNIIEVSNNLDIIELKENIQNNFQSYPSIQFGFETAIYDLLSKEEEIPLSKYLNSSYLKKILCNSIINFKSDISKIKNVAKIKITSLSINKYKLFFEKIFNTNSNIKLRLDFNGNLNLTQAKKWVNELSDFNIDYIEQPLPKDQILELAELNAFSKIPIAVDESINNLDSIFKIIEYNCADIFIIKPMILGGYINSKKIIDLGIKNDIKSIITTTLETEIGFLANVHIASALNITDYCGFSTWNLFLQNPPSYVIDNNIFISKKAGLGY